VPSMPIITPGMSARYAMLGDFRCHVPRTENPWIANQRLAFLFAGEAKDKQGGRVLPTGASAAGGSAGLRPVRPGGVKEIASAARGRQRRRSELGSSVRSEVRK